MDTRMKTDRWIYYLIIVLGITGVMSAIGTIILTIMGQPLSKLLTVLGSVAIAGLVRLLISPLNQDLFE
jgi:hypothetical protein